MSSILTIKIYILLIKSRQNAPLFNKISEKYGTNYILTIGSVGVKIHS